MKNFELLSRNFDLLCRNIEIVSRNFDLPIKRNKSICDPSALSYKITLGKTFFFFFFFFFFVSFFSQRCRKDNLLNSS